MSEIQALTAVNGDGEIVAIEAVQRYRLRCVEEHDVTAAVRGENYCRHAAELLASERTLTGEANKWAREAVEFGVAVGGMIPKGEVGAGRGNKITTGVVILDESQQQRSNYRALATVPAEERESFYAKCEADGDTISKSALRRLGKKIVRADDIEAQVTAIKDGAVTLPAGVFDLIDVDPPWPYEDEMGPSTYDPANNRGAFPYPSMSLDAITSLPVLDHAADDCVLWLWTTHRFMRHAFPILDAWGFQERAILTWRKDRLGLGRWLRSQSEFCIMASRGKPFVKLTNQTTVIDGPMREHSRKPDEFYAMVEELCPAVRRLVWFGRELRSGWHVGGNEPEKFDV